MKYIFSLIVMCAFVSTSFAQNITWEDDYIKALQTTEETNSILLFYFKDGNQKTLEQKIERSILKSRKFKASIGKSVVILTIDNSDNSKNITYNNRLVSAYNPEQKFPALIAKSSKFYKKTSLLKEFTDKDINMFISELNTLKN